MPRTAKHSRRRSRTTSCSIIAIATVMAVGATPASAQSLLGTGTYFTNPNATGIVAPIGGTTTTINLNGGQTVIDWIPTDNATGTGTNINFQNAGTTALFTGSSDFAVLNRVLPTDISRAIVMNGTVNSRVGGSQRGSVYFYSPSGFIFGGTSVFSVGSLVVTALPITLSSGNFINGPGNTVVFGQALNPNAAVISGGTINASSAPLGIIPPGNSYVAMVAPRVAHSGAITVNGSAALVAAEAATINFSPDGLFDIQVTVGTTSSDGISVTGDIGGPTPTGSTDKQSVFLVAVPKNQALTMLIANGADLGFTLANNASIDDNGVVVLSGGHNIVDGQIAGKSAAPGTGTAGFSFTGAHATNNVVAEATGNVAIYSVSPNLSTTFDNNLTVHSDGNIAVSSSGSNAVVSVAGNLSLSTDRVGTATPSVTAGNISLAALNTGTISVGGSMNLSADAVGGDTSSGTAGSGTGGAISITATDDSSLTLDSLTTSATGMGGNALAGGVNGGAGTGGDITLTANNGSSITVNSPLTFDVQGTGGSGGGAGSGGSGTGGDARIEVGDNASLTFSGDVILDADGFGGGSGSGTGGTGTGGTATLGSVLNSSSGGLMTFNGEVELLADGEGGQSNDGTGGIGNGGTAQLTSNAHHFVLNDFTLIHAGGRGGSSGTSTGGIGQGGTAAINLIGSSELDATFVAMDAKGHGGSGAIGGTGLGGNGNIISESDATIGTADINAGAAGGNGFDGNGGLADGGTINVGANNGGDLTIGDLQVDAFAQGGEAYDLGTTSGAGLGGDIFVQALANGTLSLGSLDADADGMGGSTGFQVAGGLGSGGNITVEAFGTNAALSITGNAFLTANGYGGEGLGDCFLCGGAGGDGSGGHVFVRANGATTSVNLGNVDAQARGFGGLGLDFDGGDGTGGTVQFSAIDGGALDVAGYLYGSASGFGGDRTESGYGGDSNMFAGDGAGGEVEILTFGSGNPVIRIGDYAQIDANGYGGDVFFQQLFQEGGGPSFADESIQGGDGTGGRAGIYSNAGRISDDDIPSNDGGILIGGYAYVDANGYGGNAQGGFGGDGRGKNAEIVAFGGDVAIGGTAYISADGGGGYGDFGGDGFGGGIYDPETATGVDGAHIFARDGAITLGSADVSADGYGGDAGTGFFYGGGTGGDGGDGTGGWASIHASNGNAGPSSITIQGVESYASVSASGFGGDGDSGFDGVNGIDGLPGSNGNTGGPGEAGTDGTDAGAGGNGGEGTGGFAAITAAAGNGALTIDSAWAYATGQGGHGGDGGFAGNGGNGGPGGTGDAGPGGDGGDGGNGGAGGNGGLGGIGTGGSVTVGTQSGPAQATGSNLGVATFGTVYADASGYGGDGGAAGGGGFAGSGGTGGGGATIGADGSNGSFGTDGIGGDGGDAVGGAVTLLVRGSTVNILDTANLYADAYAGDGGFGVGDFGIEGNGGDATVGGDGGIGVLVTPRYQFPTQLGTLNAGSINGSAFASAGTGSIFGTSNSLGANYVIFLNSTGNLGSLDFNISADGLGAGAQQDRISIVGSNVTVANSFSFQTVGDLSLLVDNGQFDVGTLTLTAGNFVHDGATPTNLGTTIADDVFVTTGGDFVADTNWDVTNTFVVDAPGLIDVDNIHDDNGIDFSAGGSISITSLDAGSYVDLLAGGDINTGNIDAGSGVNEQSTGGSINVGDINAGGFVSLDAGTFINGADITTFGSISAQSHDGDINLANLTSTFGTITLLAAGDIFLNGDALADGDIELTADGNILMHNATSHQSIDVDGGGYVDGDNLTAGDTVEVAAGGSVTLGDLSAGIVNPSFNSEAEFNVGILAGGAIHTGNIEAAENIGLATPGTMTTGDIDAGNAFMALGHGNMNFGDADVGNEIYLADFSMMALGGTITGGFDPLPILAATPTPTGGSITIGDVNAGKFTAAAGTNLTTGIINSDGGIGLGAGGAITTGNLFAGDFVLANGGSISTGDIEADSVDMTSTAGNITTGDVFAFGAVAMDAFGDILAGDILAGSIDLLAGDDITTGDLSTQQLFLLAQEGSGGKQFLFPGASITLEAGGDISTGNIDSIDGVFADAGGGISTGTIDAVDFVQLAAVNSIVTGAIDAGDFIEVFTSNGGITTGNLAGTDIDLEAAGAISFGAVNAEDLDFDAGGSVTGGNIVVATVATGNAGGNITLGNISAGPGTPVDDFFSVGFAAIGNINVGNVSGAGRVGFAAQGNLTTGNLTAGTLVMTLVGGNTTTGSITTTASGSEVYMADDSMFITGGGTPDGEGDFDPNIVLALNPVATGGSITINGAVTTGLFRAAAGTSLTTQAITAGEIDARAIGTATINGLWSAPLATLASSDIDIAATGGIAAGAGGEVNLLSSNTQRMLIGDGLSGGAGYALSNAEFGRISAGNISIIAGAFPGAAADTFVGNLTVTAGPSGNIRSANGGLAIVGLNEAGTERDGSMRVLGNVTGSGFATTNYLAFATQTFELDAATGSISLTSTGSTLSGEIDLFADRIHVASSTILNQLAANPTYSGYQQDLNEAATVQRPEGVLRASSLWIESDNLQDVLIQNTGTAATPAGFLVNDAFINDDDEVAGPPASINLIVNGQVIREGATLTGIEARDALTEEADLSPFTANSTINGCPLTGPCVIRPEQPPVPPTVVDDQIDLITFDPLGDSDFGNEPDIDDNQEGDEGANNPISPPQPLFDTRPLIPASDVNDPVSGTGNPSLLGSSDCDKDDEGQCATDKEEGQ